MTPFHHHKLRFRHHLLLLGFSLLLLCSLRADAYKIVSLEEVTPRTGEEKGTIDVRVKYSSVDTLPAGFRKADWTGQSPCNFIYPCDWIGIWKEDKRDSSEGCEETAEGWKCPSATQYTSGKDLVKRAGFMTIDTPYRELTSTTKDSKYHVYYCLTPQFVRKWTSYDCIARTEFLLPDIVGEAEEASRLKRSVSTFVKINLSDRYETDTDDVVLVSSRPDTKIQALIELDENVPSSLDEGFAGVFKVRGEDSTACSKIPDEDESKKEDSAVFLCDVSHMLTVIDEGSIHVRPSSTETVDLKWDRTPKMDSDGGYAVFFCMSNKFSLLNILFKNNQIRCFARTALFKVTERTEGPTWSSSTERREEEEEASSSEFDSSTCLVQPPKITGFHKVVTGAKDAMNRIPGFGFHIADRVLGVFTPNDNSVNALKMRYFDRFKYVDEVYGMLLGYDSVRILNTQGKVRISFKDNKLKISAFKRDHSSGNFNDEVKDCRHGHTSVASLDLDLVNVKMMKIADPSKWIGSSKMRLKIDFALNLKATYVGSKRPFTERFDEEFFETFFNDEEASERSIEVGTMCKVRLENESDDPTEFRYEGKVTAIHGSESGGTLSYDMEFANGAVRLKVPARDVQRVAKSQWKVDSKDIKICITDVDIQLQSNGGTCV